MASPWCRLWGDMPNDPKWRTIARVSKQSIGNVIAVYVHMMACASSQPNATERGRTLGWRDEDVATALDLETEQVIAIRDAMQGRVLEDDYLTGWEKRQSLREDEGAAGRAKAYREREKAKKQAEEEAKKNADKKLKTKPNASERKQTPEVDVEVEVEIKDPPIPPKGGEGTKEKKSTAVALATFLETCKQEKIKPIPEADPVFVYAEKVGIPSDFLRLHWLEFKDRYSLPDAKRYKAWPTVFGKSVRGNWFKLWFVGNDGNYALTTVGQQAQRNHAGPV